MGGFKTGHRIRHVGTRCDTDAADLSGQRVRHVVPIEVERRDDAVIGRAQQNLLQERVGDHILDHDRVAGLRIFKRTPRPAVDWLGMEFALRQGISGVAEQAFGVLHDVALVHQSDRGLVVINRVLNRLAHQSLSPFDRNRLDADSGRIWEADLFDPEFILQESDQALRFFIIMLIFNTGINIL